MNRLLAAVLSVLTAINTVAAEGLVNRTQAATSGRPLRYLLYLPQQDQSSKQSLLPLVLFLHGGGEGGNDLEKVKKHGLPKLIAAGNSFPFIVAAPQNPSETQFWNDQQLIKLLDELESSYPVDRSRIYLTGLSRGGFAAWRLAIQNPERFAALVPVCGGGPKPYAQRVKHLPIWGFHGAKDSVIPIDESQRMVEALRGAGADVKFTIYPEAGHDAWTNTYQNPELYSWMLQQRLPSDRDAAPATDKVAPFSSPQAEAAVLSRLEEVQQAATALNPEKVFDFVLKNDNGSLLQNGEFFRTREEALKSTQAGFRGLRQIAYRFDQQHVTFLSPTVALVTGSGSSSAVTDDGKELATRFSQSVVLVLTNGEWMVFHAHRSFAQP